MLVHHVIGPSSDGTFAVGYRTPGLPAFTAVVTGCTKAYAGQEAQRLNREQFTREKALQADRLARGLRGVYHLKGGN